MKKSIAIVLFAGLSSALLAQKIRVSESHENIGGASHNALIVSVYEVDAKDVEKEWKSQMKGYGAKVSNNNGEWYGNNAVIKELGKKTIDIYARVEDKKDEVKLIVAFDLGGAWLTSSDQKDQYKQAETILHDFAFKLTKESIDNQVKNQQKALDKLTGQQKDLVKQNTNLNNEVSDYQNRIKKDQDAIEKNKKDQEEKQKDIEKQQKVVEELNKKDKEVE